MKKVLLILIFIASFSHSFAVQGTCSYHGGVNCNAGADYDGSAICNDGWRDSSEYFSETLLCRGDRRPLCTSEELTSIKSKYRLDEQDAQIETMMAQLSSENITFPVQFVTGQQASEQNNAWINRSKKISEISMAQTKRQIDFNRTVEECRQLGEKRSAEKSQNYYSQYLNALNNINLLNNTAPSISCPLNSTLSSDGKTCSCNFSFKTNSSNTGCEFDTNSIKSAGGTCPENSSMKDGYCQCNTGYSYTGSSCLADAVPVFYPPVVQKTGLESNVTPKKMDVKQPYTSNTDLNNPSQISPATSSRTVDKQHENSLDTNSTSTTNNNPKEATTLKKWYTIFKNWFFSKNQKNENTSF